MVADIFSRCAQQIKSPAIIYPEFDVISKCVLCDLSFSPDVFIDRNAFNLSAL